MDSHYSDGIRRFSLQLFRLGVLVVIALLIRSHHTELRVQGDWPITVGEVRPFLEDAHRLRIDSSSRGGLEVFNSAGEAIGYAVRTMPASREIVGYSGPSDVLVVFDSEEKGVGIAIRHSYDTPSHVEDVRMEFIFMESWNGRSWEEIAAIEDFNEARIYGVSGATRTSEAVMQSVTHRLAVTEGGKVVGPRWQFGWQDFGLLGFLAGGCLFAFVKGKKFQKWRWIFSIATILILGLWMGDLIAQSLLVGWAQSRVPWEATPGLALFVLAAFLIPWFTKQPLYCQFICPHGNLQRWTMKVVPAGWKRRLSKDAKWISRFAPVMLLIIVLVVSFLQLDFDLAGIEPFDAYILKSAGLATLLVAGLGLFISLFVPMAYCRFGCPTGWLLEFVRKRSGKDRFGERDWIGMGLLGLAVLLWVIPDGWIMG